MILIDSSLDTTSNYTQSVSLGSNTAKDVSFGRYNTKPSNALSLTVFAQSANTILVASNSTYRCPVCPPIEVLENMRVSWSNQVSRCLQVSLTSIDLTVDRLGNRSGRFETIERNIDVTLHESGEIVVSSSSSSSSSNTWMPGDLLVNLRHNEHNVRGVRAWSSRVLPSQMYSNHFTFSCFNYVTPKIRRASLAFAHSYCQKITRKPTL